jgi:hypothetical protein
LRTLTSHSRLSLLLNVPRKPHSSPARLHDGHRPGGCAAEGARSPPRQRPRLGRGRSSPVTRGARERLPRGGRAAPFTLRRGHRRGRHPEGVGEREAGRPEGRVRPPHSRTRTHGAGEPPAEDVAASRVAVRGVIRRVRSNGDGGERRDRTPSRAPGDVLLPARPVPLAAQTRTRRAAFPGVPQRQLARAAPGDQRRRRRRTKHKRIINERRPRFTNSHTAVYNRLLAESAARRVRARPRNNDTEQHTRRTHTTRGA